MEPKVVENELLLNAIKNKFAADSTQSISFSPPKFTIPTLKATSAATSQAPSAGTSPLNQFLLRQLQERNTQQSTKDGQTGVMNGFVLPNLQSFGNVENHYDKVERAFEIPVLKASSSSNISSLTTAINKLQVKETSSAKSYTSSPAIPTTTTNLPEIDLSAALASKSSQHQGTPPTRAFHVKQKNSSISKDNDDFEIPFIDCDRDRLHTKCKVLVPLANEYCQIDISENTFEAASCIQEPSAVGHFLCIEKCKYVQAPLKYMTSADQYKKPVKHVIEPFQFNTKSPDDLVLAALGKYQRRHFN